MKTNAKTPVTRRRAGATGLVALLGLSWWPVASGCSLVFVEGPPSQHGSLGYFDCTSSQLAPVTDLILGGIEGLAGTDTLSGGTNRDAASYAPLAVAAGFLASGIYGYRQVAACKEAKAALIMRTMDRSRATPAGDPWLAPGPTPAPHPGAGWSGGVAPAPPTNPYPAPLPAPPPPAPDPPPPPLPNP